MNIDRLKEIRNDKDYNQKEIAKLLKTSQVQYSKYETGIRMIPVDKLVILAQFYKVSIDYLVGLTNTRTIYPRIK